MGMYTEFYFNAELKHDTPDDVVAMLRFMLGTSADKPPLPDDPLFSTERWRYMLMCDSAYFDADTHSTLRADHNTHFLCIRCNLKNYDHEIQHFVSWISPYLEKDEGDFLGFSRYEETEQPTLIFHGGTRRD